MHKTPNGADMVFQFLRERQGFAHQPRDALAQGTVEAFDVIRFASFLTACAMTFGRENGGIGRPKISVGDGALTINSGQRRPQTLGTRLVSRPNMYADDFAGGYIDG